MVRDMTLVPFGLSDGLPNPDAALINIILTQALYNRDQKLFDDFADFIGGQVVFYNDDPTTYPPQVGVITVNKDAWVFIAGTTTSAQALGHVGGSIAAAVDKRVPTTIGLEAQVNSSFLFGAVARLDEVFIPIIAINPETLYFTGHSYGAAVAHIFARWASNGLSKPSRVELMTFGQPRTYDARPAIKEPDYYARIINPGLPEVYQYENLVVDPVTTCPPPIALLGKVGAVSKFLQKYLGFIWGHHGEPFLCNPTGFARPVPIIGHLELLPFFNQLESFNNIQWLPAHYAVNYMDRILKIWEEP